MTELEGASVDGPYFERKEGATHRSHLWPGSREPRMLAQGVLLEVNRHEGNLNVKVTNLVGAHSFPVNRRHRAEVMIISSSSGQSFWKEPFRLAPDSTAQYSVKLSKGKDTPRIELRFYPAPAVWPDSFYILDERLVE